MTTPPDIHPSLKVITCLCSHTKSRHRGAWGERNAGNCKDCVCEQFEIEPTTSQPTETPMTKPPPIQPLSFTLRKLPLHDIGFSPNNPRKDFDVDKLDELAKGIATVGILQPPAVRLVNGKHVLIWGERRTRAAALAGLKEIDVKVYEVDEMKAAELALIENDDREDLTALERADGYRELQKKFGLSVDQIAERVNKGRATVYSAMKLCDLADVGQKAVVAGQLDPSCAELIAALPAHFHAELVARALGTSEPTYGRAPVKLSFRELKALIAAEYMLKLKGAPFDTTDADLVPKAGACTNCPKRTGASLVDVFAGTEPKGPQHCQDVTCYAAKTAAHKRQKVSEAKAEDRPVLTAGESKAALSSGYYGRWIKLAGTFRQANGQEKTWSKELGPDFEAKLAVDSNGRFIKVALKEDVRKALVAKGSKAATVGELTEHSQSSSKPATKEEMKAAEEKREASKQRREVREKVVKAAIGKIVDEVHTNGMPLPLLRFIAKQTAIGWRASEAFVRRGLISKPVYDEKGKYFDKHFAKATEDELLGLIFEAGLEELAQLDHEGDTFSEQLVEACKVADVDLEQLEADLTPPSKAVQEWVCKRGCGLPWGEHAGTKCPPDPKRRNRGGGGGNSQASAEGEG